MYRVVVDVPKVAALFLFGGILALSQPPDPQSRGLRPVASGDQASSFRTGKAYALIIATDEYDDHSWPRLQNPINDARTIAAELKQNYGYQDPDLLLNPALEQVSRKLRTYLQMSFSPGDSLLVFIAGHGRFDDAIREGYLVFKDARHDDPLNDSYLPHSKLRRVIDSIQCRRILLIIDACFGGTIDDRVATRGAENLSYPAASRADILARKSALKTRLFLTSGGKEYVPDGKPGANSPFATQVLGALRTYGGDSGLVTFQDLFQRAESVQGPQPQYGWFGTADPGSDFWFATDRAILPNPAELSHSKELPQPLETEAGANLRTRVNPLDGLTYVFIPPGNFMMGCSPGDSQCYDNEKPSEAEEITRGFWLGQTEVTQRAWKELSGGDNPGYPRGNQLPVDHLNWDQAKAYCTAVGGRLPTEKEWEYAARAGTTGPLYGPLDAVAWYEGNSGGGMTHPVGLKQPNAFQLYDMLGNAPEWTSNKYDFGEGVAYVTRGGSSNDPASTLRVSRKMGAFTPVRPGYKGPGVRCILN